MPQTVEVEVFTFEELSETAKKKALEKSYQTYSEFWDGSDVIDCFTEALEADGIVTLARYPDGKAKVFYSGFGSQGDGASWAGEVSIARILEYWGETEKYPTFYAYCKENNHTATISQSGYYSHSGTMRCDLESYYADSELDPDEAKTLGTLEADILHWAQRKAKDLFSDLQTDYYYCTSDEYIIEAFREDETMFRENGTRWY